MNLFYAVLIVHFIADFLLQSREMGKRKSSESKYLLAHLAIQFACFALFGLKFAFYNALVHGIIDWNIWRIYKNGLSFGDSVIRKREKSYARQSFGIGKTLGFMRRLDSTNYCTSLHSTFYLGGFCEASQRSESF